MIRAQTRIVIASGPVISPCVVAFDLCYEQEEAFDLACSVRSPSLEIPQGAERAFSFLFPETKSLADADEIIFKIYERNVNGVLLYSALLSDGRIILPTSRKARAIVTTEESRDFPAGPQYYELWVIDSIGRPALGLAGEFFVQDTREYD